MNSVTKLYAVVIFAVLLSYVSFAMKASNNTEMHISNMLGVKGIDQLERIDLRVVMRSDVKKRTNLNEDTSSVVAEAEAILRDADALVAA